MKDIFLTNHTELTFLDKLKDSISKAKALYFSVSFIKKAGLILFERDLEEALNKGVKIKIITSTYQNFTDIASLNTFYSWSQKYPNFSCHLDFNCFGDNGFHSKGYLFEYYDHVEFLVGSTNITRYALLKNVEWNVSLDGNQIDSFDSALSEFKSLWEHTLDLTPEVIRKYSIMLDYAIEKWDMDYVNPDVMTIKPNYMQRKALKEIRRYRDQGIKKMLIIAATGSGKTFLVSFDAKNFDAKRLLYIVHRDAILTSARESFVKVFAGERSCGLFTGKTQELDCDFIFATNTMLSKHLDLFTKNEFDYIVYDECHHASADSYKKIMNYFTPEFTLGLTATPERMDNQDIYELFEQNVPFELRLRDAIINDLVVPFHYYAIRDEFADYSSNDKARIAREIAKTNNVEFISSQIRKHQKINEKLKAIAFCTSIAHCTLMAEGLQNEGFDAVALTGANNLGERIKAFNDLQNENNSLEIICTVDILNEGVDIPGINMVLFLRPTESQTVFLQQLGRGLRKYQNKEYVTVLDFIGNNYGRSIQIALALGTLGKTTYTEKAYLKDLIDSNFDSLGIPGVEIFFDDLAKTEIINYIDKENFNATNYLKKDYENFKKYLKKEEYPSHMDFLNSEIAPDLLRFIKSKILNKKNMSYYNFLKKIDEESIPLFNENEIDLINNISDMLPLVRVDEYLIISNFLNNKSINLNSLIGYNKKVTIETLNHALKMLNKSKILIDDKLPIDNISKDLNEYLLDLLSYGITRYDVEFGEYDGKFKYLGNYYKEQVMRVLLADALMFMKGTKFDEDGTTYIFVGLKKDSSKEERLNYKDKFIDSTTFQWESENNTTLDNSIGKKILNTKIVHLFVRKMKDENNITLPFTYFGTGKFTNIRETKNNEFNTLTLDVILDNEVPEDYYLDLGIEKKEVIS